ncbi:unnamed protein product [Paramecium primaurelia]|uniref:Uncharacterized protein n=1 Tax=Paramecium primaurelia TaxID=5886 RepID=A0A8S1ND04_PARPR|nr:unnamed protein product [Paramecium primaurelia]
MNQGLNNKSKAIIIKQPYPTFMRALNLSKNTKSNHEIPKEQQQIATQRTQRTIIPSIKSISNKNSQEKIRVYDVFKQIPRNKSQSYHNQINKMDESRDILTKLNQQKIINVVKIVKKHLDFQNQSKQLIVLNYLLQIKKDHIAMHNLQINYLR